MHAGRTRDAARLLVPRTKGDISGDEGQKDWRSETLASEHMNARNAYIYAFALLSGVDDLRSMASRMRLEEGAARG